MRRTHRFFIKSNLRYHVDADAWFLFNIAASQTPVQRLFNERLSNNQGLDFREDKAPDGVTRFHALSAPAGPLEVVYEVEVERDELDCSVVPPATEATLVSLPSVAARFLYPSRYCESDKLVRFANMEFGQFAPGHERVMGICNWIFNHIVYLPGTTDSSTSAFDCATLRAGVCRDFAHLGIAFCRALGIPARYASGYAFLLQPPDYHAFFEVWLEGAWWYYDATRLAPQHGFIRVGSGHDAADTSVATMSATAQFVSMEISVEARSMDRVEYAEGPVTFFPQAPAK